MLHYEVVNLVSLDPVDIIRRFGDACVRLIELSLRHLDKVSWDTTKPGVVI
jgi:hypothetical protein